MSSQKKAYLALTVTSIVWGTTWVASKMGVSHMPAFELASIRQFLGGSIYILFFLLIKKEKFPTAKQFMWLVPMAFLMFVSSNGIATYGLQFITSGLAALIAALYPLSVVLIERFYYKDSLQVHVGNYALGVGLSMFAMLTWSIGSIIISRTKININQYYSIGWQMFISALVMGLFTFISGNYIAITKIPAISWWVIIYMVIGGSIFAFVSFIYSMKHLHPGIASLYAYINPIVAIWVGSLLIKGEEITWNSILGTIATLTGVYLVNRSLKKQKDPVEVISDADGM
jgi:drug/metabolite transporter (DMT)-like permease